MCECLAIWEESEIYNQKNLCYTCNIMKTYIVFDLEWNQSPVETAVVTQPIYLAGEIIEIGAVKLNSDMQILDEYQVLIQPRVYRKLHFRTKEIIQLDMKDLENGTAFYKAIREFLKWCGEDYTFCTWGSMDLTELQRNMMYHGMEIPFEFPLCPYRNSNRGLSRR